MPSVEREVSVAKLATPDTSCSTICGKLSTINFEQSFNKKIIRSLSYPINTKLKNRLSINRSSLHHFKTERRRVRRIRSNILQNRTTKNSTIEEKAKTEINCYESKSTKENVKTTIDGKQQDDLRSNDLSVIENEAASKPSDGAVKPYFANHEDVLKIKKKLFEDTNSSGIMKSEPNTPTSFDSNLNPINLDFSKSQTSTPTFYESCFVSSTQIPHSKSNTPTYGTQLITGITPVSTQIATPPSFQKSTSHGQHIPTSWSYTPTTFGHNALHSHTLTKSHMNTPTLMNDIEKFDLRQTLDQLQRDIRLYRDERKLLVRENEDLKNENARLNQNINSSLNSARLQIDIKNKALEEQRQVVINLKEVSENLGKGYDLLKSEFEGKLSSFKDKEKELAELNKIHADIILDNKLLKAKSDSLQNENVTLMKNYDDLKKLYEIEKGKVSELEKINNCIQKSFAQTQGSLDLKNEWLQEVESKYVKSEEEKKDIQFKMNVIKSHLKIIENNCMNISHMQEGSASTLKYVEQFHSMDANSIENTNESIINNILLFLNKINSRTRLCQDIKSFGCRLQDIISKNNQLSKELLPCRFAIESCKANIEKNSSRILALETNSNSHRCSCVEEKIGKSIPIEAISKVYCYGDDKSSTSHSSSELNDSNVYGSP